jgi:hypothetical protein
MIQKYYSGYYDFICACYPKYSFKRWEFKILDCPNGYWKNIYNTYYYIRERINYMFENEIINTYSDIFKLSSITLDEIFCGSFTNSLGKGYSTMIMEYLDFCKIKYEINKKYDGIVFDSLEEIDVYKVIKKCTNNVFKNTKIRFHNDKYNENYIPDFIINDNIILEYFGLYGYKEYDNNVFDYYNAKTERKIEYFSNLKDYKFIALFPKDIWNKNKLYAKLKNILEGGEIFE